MRLHRGIPLLCLALGGLIGCQQTEPAAMPPALIGRGPALPVSHEGPASASASPEPFARIPLAVGPEGLLAIYDRASQDVLVVPGAGAGLENFAELAPYQVLFDDGQDIWLVDVLTEERVKVVSGGEVGGYAFAPSVDGLGNLYFLGAQRPAQTGAFAYAKHVPTGSQVASGSVPSLLEPYLEKPRFLAPINAVAARHGGVTSINVDGSGLVVVVTTQDGGVYGYFPQARQLQALLPAHELGSRGAATSVNVDPVWGRFVVWEDPERHGIWTLDRWSGQLDALPYVQLGLGVVAAQSPHFYGADPTHVVFMATYADGHHGIVAYDLLSETTQVLSRLNGLNPHL